MKHVTQELIFLSLRSSYISREKVTRELVFGLTARTPDHMMERPYFIPRAGSPLPHPASVDLNFLHPKENKTRTAA